MYWCGVISPALLQESLEKLLQVKACFMKGPDVFSRFKLERCIDDAMNNVIPNVWRRTADRNKTYKAGRKASQTVRYNRVHFVRSTKWFFIFAPWRTNYNWQFWYKWELFMNWSQGARGLYYYTLIVINNYVDSILCISKWRQPYRILYIIPCSHNWKNDWSLFQ